ncbi:DEAD/DEAH box helicase [Gammaproteobacteria bacterium]
MEPASSLFTLPFRKTLRDGQQLVVESATKPGVTSLNAQLPTGYGKTLTACCVYSDLSNRGNVNRLLYIVPTTAQLDQFVSDGISDLIDAGVQGSLLITDVTYVGDMAIKAHRKNTSQVFAITVQSLTSGRAWETVRCMMETGRWMIVIDEYHHYGLDAHWGRRVSQLNSVFRLAMSATPYRPENDGAFGDPNITIRYKEAEKEKAVKPLKLHSYVYRLDIIQNGEVTSYTTEQLTEQLGTESPEKIDQIMLTRQMRWSPKYVSPLVDKPIARMLRNRIITGYPLQALIGAMSCAHADLVCQQIKSMYPELRVDWVGTGANGRPDKENANVLAKFCPPKVEGKRRPQDIELDVLVHVGMAGEGLDSVFVSEVIHLNNASINNSNNQENGRAARYLPGVIGFINVDSCSPYAKFAGELIMDVMDDPNAEPGDTDEDTTGKNPSEDVEWPEVPDEPTIRLWDMECIRVDDGEVKRLGAASARIGGLSESEILAVFENPSHPNHAQWMRMAENHYRQLRQREAEEFNSKSTIVQWEEQVNNLLSHVTGNVIKLMSSANTRIEKSMPGDIKKRINGRKKMSIGPVEKDVTTLRRHWNWLKNLDDNLRTSGVPAWLM